MAHRCARPIPASVISVGSASRFELEGEPGFDLDRAPRRTVGFEAPMHQSVFDALLLSRKCTDDVDMLRHCRQLPIMIRTGTLTNCGPAGTGSTLRRIVCAVA